MIPVRKRSQYEHNPYGKKAGFAALELLIAAGTKDIIDILLPEVRKVGDDFPQLQIIL